MIEFDKEGNRILIVDDEESLRLTFKMFLTKEGYGQVDVASTFEDAMDLIDRHTYDLIISDIVLEGNSGIDLLRYLKESGATCPVVMVTGYPNIESASEAVRLGAFDYITKPFQHVEVLARVKTHLMIQSLRKSVEEKNLELHAINKNLEKLVEKKTEQILAQEKSAIIGRLLQGMVHNLKNQKFQSLCPTLVFFGENDHIIDFGGIKDFIHQIESKEKLLAYIPKAYHELLTDKEANNYGLYEKIILWIKYFG